MAMTFEQAMQALRNADASGDMEDAAKLAEIADKLRPTTPTEPVYTGDIPTEVEHGTPTAHKNSITDKIAQTVSGGKYGTLQDLFYGGENPDELMLENFGQLVHNSGVEGLTGIGPVGEATLKGSKLASKVSEYVPSAIPQMLTKIRNTTAPVAEKIGEVASDVGTKIKKLPGEILGRTSGMVDPKAVNILAKLEREGNPEILKAIKEGADTPVVNRMVYNYARQHGLDHDDAAKAVDMVRGHSSGLGSWDIYDKQLTQGLAEGKSMSEIFPKYEDYSKLDLPSQLKLAKQAGVDMSTYLPQKKVGKAIAGVEGLKFGPDIYHATRNIADIAQNLGSLKMLPLILAQSPKAVGNAARTVGKVAHITDKYIAPTVKKYGTAVLNAPVTPQMLGGMGVISEKDGGSIYPMSLKHVYFHRKKRNG